jgi:hypothetical protein
MIKLFLKYRRCFSFVVCAMSQESSCQTHRINKFSFTQAIIFLLLNLSNHFSEMSDCSYSYTFLLLSRLQLNHEKCVSFKRRSLWAAFPFQELATSDVCVNEECFSFNLLFQRPHHIHCSLQYFNRIFDFLESIEIAAEIDHILRWDFVTAAVCK